MKNPETFIVRVYGIILNAEHEVLLTDEFQLNRKMTKFPGGGLEYGEGTIDCLRREIREECNGQELKNIRHFYTTDFFQQAFFFEKQQIISIYYLAELKNTVSFTISRKQFDFEKMENGSQSFRWIKLNELKEGDLSFPIDKFVAGKLKSENFENG